jgi:hypothetical protein
MTGVYTPVAGEIDMSTKSAIVISAAILIGAAAAGLAKQHPSFMMLVRTEPGIVRSAPAGEIRGIRLQSGEEAFAFHQGSRMFLAVPPLR